MKIIVKKLKMTQVWQEDTVVPVTVLGVVSDDKEVLKNIKEGDRLVLSGKSKGKGFQGVVKRHGFHGGPKSHGQKHSLRAPGSIGATAPQRTIPGKKMPGRMGGDTITIKNVLVVKILPEENSLMIKGAVPGMRGTKLIIKTINH